MAVNSVVTHTYDLESPLVITPLRHALATGDQLGDRFDIAVTQKGRPADLTGAGVTGYFIRTADGATVVVTGTAVGNVASVTLPESCYAVPGRFTLTIKVSLGGVRHAVYVGEGAVLRSSTDTIIDPGHEIPDLDELLAMISQVESAASAAQSAAQQATGAAGSANSSAQAANSAAAEANRAKGEADTAAANANAAAGTANASAAAADTATGQANAAANAANTAAGAANTATGQANEAAANANARAEYLANATFSAHTVAPGGSATVTETDENGHAHFDFGLVKGDTGDGDVSSVWGVRPDENGDAKPEIGGRNLVSLQDFIFNQSKFTDSSYRIVSPAPDNFANEMIELKTSEDISSPNNGFFGVNAIFQENKGYSQVYNLQPNEFVTLSCKIRVTSGAAELNFHYLTKTETVIPHVRSLDNRWSTHYTVMKTTGYLTGEIACVIYFTILEPNTTIQICDVKLERGSVPTDWSPAPEDKQDKIDMIGGTNLYTGTKDFSGNGWVAFSNYEIQPNGYKDFSVFKKTGVFAGPRQVIKAKAGEVYTISAWLKAENVTSVVAFFHGYVEDLDAFVPQSVNVTNKMVSGEFTRISATATIQKDVSFSPRFENENDENGILYTCGIKVEKGAVPTDWSPAPEDLENPERIYSPNGTNIEAYGNLDNNWYYSGINFYASGISLGTIRLVGFMPNYDAKAIPNIQIVNPENTQAVAIYTEANPPTPAAIGAASTADLENLKAQLRALGINVT